MKIYYTDQFNYDKEEKRFSQELSSLGDRCVPREFEMMNPLTWNCVKFGFIYADKSADQDGEEDNEILGWNYAGYWKGQRLEALIIND